LLEQLEERIYVISVHRQKKLKTFTPYGLVM